MKYCHGKNTRTLMSENHKLLNEACDMIPRILKKKKKDNNENKPTGFIDTRTQIHWKIYG